MSDKLSNLKTYSFKRPLGNVKIIKLKDEEKKKDDLDIKIAKIKRDDKVVFTGRDYELSELRQAFNSQKKNLLHFKEKHTFPNPNELSAKPLIIGIKGEAGIGKSRLVSEFLEVNSKNYLKGIADISSRNPYSLFVSMIKSYCQINNSDNIQEMKNKLKFALNELSNFEKAKSDKKNLISSYNILSYLLGINSKVYKKDHRLKLPASELKIHIQLSIKYFIEAVAAKVNFSNEPLVILCEDIHWIDDSSRNTLTYLFNTLNIDKNNPEQYRHILFLMLYRPDFKIMREVELKKEFSEIELQPLSYESIQKILQSKIYNKDNKLKTITDKNIKALAERSEGNPLFIQEWIKMYSERIVNGNIPKIKSKTVKTENKPVEIPDSINTLINKRLDRLSDSELKTLQIASVIGNDFTDTLLKKISGMLSSDQSVEFILIELIENKFIKYSDKVFGFEKYYEFHHDVIRKIIYETITEENKIILHKTVGEAIEDLFQDKIEQNYYTLCEHFENGKAENKTLEYLEKTGDWARDNFENEKAVEYYEKLGEKLIEKNIEPFAIILKKIQIYKTIGNWKEALKICRENLAHFKFKKTSEFHFLFSFNIADIYFHQSNYLLSIKQLLLLLKYAEYKNDHSKNMEILGLLCLNYYESGNPNKAEINATEYFEISKNSDVEINFAKANEYLGLVEKSRGNFRIAIEYYQKSFKLYQILGDKFKSAILLNRIGINYYSMSEYSHALEYYQKCKTLTEKNGDIREYINVIGNIGIVYNAMGNISKAKTIFYKRLALAKRINYKEAIASTFASIGNCNYDEKKFEESLNNYTLALKVFKEINMKLNIASMFCNIALIHMHKGNFGDARNNFKQQLKINEMMKNKDGLYLAFLNMGNLFKKINQFVESEKYYKKAIKYAGLIESKLLLSIAYFNYSELLYFNNKLEKADEYIEIALSIKDNTHYKREVFHFKLLDLVIKFNIELKNNPFKLKNFDISLSSSVLMSIITKAENLLFEAIEDEGKAKVHYELWKMYQKIEYKNMKNIKHGKLALKYFKTLFKQTADIEYQNYISELS